MTTSLDDVLAKAKSAAGNLAPLTPLATATPPAAYTGSGAVAGYNMSQDAFLNAGGLECDTYMQVKDAGIKLNKDWTGYIDEFEATIDLSDVQFFMGIRKEVGSNTTYAKTYDGVTTVRGESFAEIVEQFKRESQKPADPYRGADIPMTLTQGYADPKDAKRSYDADQVVGLSTSITGFKPWSSFHRKLVNGGFGSATVRVKVTFSPRKNAAGQAYGVCEFELLEVVQ